MAKIIRENFKMKPAAFRLTSGKSGLYLQDNDFTPQKGFLNN
jgi:hypothetical protein